MFPLICAKAKWDFEGIAGVDKTVAAHDTARRGEEGLEAKREGCLYKPLGLSVTRSSNLSFQRGHFGTTPCPVTASVLSGYRARGDKAG